MITSAGKTIINEIQPYYDDLLPVLRQRKDTLNITNQDIADATGLSFDFIKKYFSGQQKNPGVSSIMAICICLNVSLDAQFHNPTGSPPDSESSAMISELKTENRILTEKLKSSEQIREIQENGLKKRTNTIYGLIILIALITFALIGYLGYDVSNPAIGLIRDGRLTPFAWVPILVTAAVLCFGIAAVINAIKNKK